MALISPSYNLEMVKIIINTKGLLSIEVRPRLEHFELWRQNSLLINTEFWRHNSKYASLSLSSIDNNPLDEFIQVSIHNENIAIL